MNAISKKRCKKVRSRLTQRGEKFIEKYNFSDPRSLDFGSVPFARLMIELNEFDVKDLRLTEDETQCIQHILIDINSNLERKINGFGPHLFISLKGLIVLSNFYDAFINLPSDKVAQFGKLFANICLLFDNTLKGNQDGIKFCIGANILQKLLDTLNHCVSVCGDYFVEENLFLVRVLTTCEIAMSRMALDCETDCEIPYYKNMVSDLLSYTLTCGLTVKIMEVFKLVASKDEPTQELIPKFIQFFSALLKPRFMSEEMIKTLRSSDGFGTVSLLYEGLQKISTVEFDNLPRYSRLVVEFLLSLAKLDLTTFQEILGAEGIRLQVRFIGAFMLKYCSVFPEYDEMLQLIVEIIGFLTVHNRNNQDLIRFGRRPTILQLLVNLPFRYYCDTDLKMKLLLPTLVASTFQNPDNRVVVEDDFCYKEVESFLKIPDIKNQSPLMKVFFEKKKPL